MTKLLVSVRDAVEAEMACRAGVDLIDVKEPARGSLGPADPEIAAQIARQVAGRKPMSVALGELVEAAALPAELAAHVRYAKFGLAGCRALANWQHAWRAAIAGLPAGVTPVAVAYADWRHALAPEPWQVIEQAHTAGCGAVLIDTHDKTRGPLTNHLDILALGELLAAISGRGMLSVVAGGLDFDSVPTVVRLSPDYVAVRGAACAGDRRSTLDARRTRRLVEVVRSAPRHSRPRMAETSIE